MYKTSAVSTAPCTMHMQVAQTDCNSARDQEEEEEEEEEEKEEKESGVQPNLNVYTCCMYHVVLCVYLLC